MGALLVIGVVAFILLLVVGVYVMSRRSTGRPSGDVQPETGSNERKLDTLEDLHVRGHMKTQQYETMQDALAPNKSQEQEELKETE
jgi:FtsZ-interacting cell division protein ZipA